MTAVAWDNTQRAIIIIHEIKLLHTTQLEFGANEGRDDHAHHTNEAGWLQSKTTIGTTPSTKNPLECPCPMNTSCFLYSSNEPLKPRLHLSSRVWELLPWRRAISAHLLSNFPHGSILFTGTVFGWCLTQFLGCRPRPDIGRSHLHQLIFFGQ